MVQTTTPTFHLQALYGRCTYETLGSNVAANSSAAIAAIEVDGRLLIDGPADNSQVWSDNG